MDRDQQIEAAVAGDGLVDQGIEMGSPSRLSVDASPVEGDPVDVSGSVRIVGTGRHEVP